MTSVLNASGISPLEFMVLVLPDKAQEKIGSIHIPDSVRDRNTQAQMTGRLIASGPLAFRYEVENKFIPDIGDRVSFSRYVGTTITGEDGAEYRIMKDGDLLAVVSDKVATIT